ncbi:hypothetical protein CKO39_08835 [Rhodopseudomonas palustris]|nr:hypothetical protein CKO39_08835 [Rhodopseudomonas palustris]
MRRRRAYRYRPHRPSERQRASTRGPAETSRPTPAQPAQSPTSGHVVDRLDQLSDLRKLEAQYTDSWYASITKDAFS